MSDEPIAHVTKDGRKHPLREHLSETAELAGNFASVFGFREWGYLAGLWHDLGKYSKQFQEKLKAASGDEAHIETGGKVNHSTAGGIHSLDRFGIIGRLLAYITAGHHAGLPDWESDATGRAALSKRLLERELLAEALSGNVPPEILNWKFPVEKPFGFDPAFWIRMLFSCVVDADFLNTEEFFEPEKTAGRGKYPKLPDLLESFNEYMAEKQRVADDTKVNRIRSEILSACIEKAKTPPGIFSLTVPTGGGKTLSSMAFALNHAINHQETHGQRRIIYVIPYTSIIEQTADQFRRIFGDSVIEHHSNLDVSEIGQDNHRSRLACENWDAPLVVTTNVQFFESLYASRTSRCRKLHNIAGSVVVLDEAQLLPPEFLKPILKAIEELKENYSVTVLFCTATQPAFETRIDPGFSFEGLEKIHEIIKDPAGLSDRLKRIEVRLPEKIHEPVQWEEIAEKLTALHSVLCVVSRRDDCRFLWSLMPEGTFHLSALMCGAHRSVRIAEIRASLKTRKVTRVISTQLVEAGVDFDFPEVYRAIAGLDSIAQAGGRCNREGLLETGFLNVFVPPSRPPRGVLRQAAEIGARMLGEPVKDHLAPDRFRSFFRDLYWILGPERLDSANILRDLKPDDKFRFSFRSAALNFNLIDETSQLPVVVIYGESAKLIDQLERSGPERWLLRKLQRYIVNLPKYLHHQLREERAIREIHPGVFVQGNGNLYDENLGLCPDRSIVYDPDDLIR